MAYIYFDYKSSELQRPLAVLSSLLQQLVFQMPEFPHSLVTLYGRLSLRGKRPDLEELYSLMLEVARAFHATFVVCDALDECDAQTQRAVLLPLLKRMGRDGIALFATGRPYPEDIQDSFREGVSRIDLLAREEDLRKVVQFLVSRKNVESDVPDDYGKTPLAQAAHVGHAGIVEILIRNGAKVNSKDIDGWTPLLWACQWGHEAVVRLLIDHGAELDPTDRAGWGPLSWAAQGGHDAVIALLIEKGADVASIGFPSAKPLLNWSERNSSLKLYEALSKKWNETGGGDGQK